MRLQQFRLWLQHCWRRALIEFGPHWPRCLKIGRDIDDHGDMASEDEVHNHNNKERRRQKEYIRFCCHNCQIKEDVAVKREQRTNIMYSLCMTLCGRLFRFCIIVRGIVQHGIDCNHHCGENSTGSTIAHRAEIMSRTCLTCTKDKAVFYHPR
eukprot:SAG11_NODE_51_length_19848_cov_37.780698_3_plen_153_part_00